MSLISPISFSGKLTRSYTEYHNYSGAPKTVIEGLDKKDISKSYDDAISLISIYKQYALKLDNLMHDDKDIQEAIQKLPDDFQININNKFRIGAYDMYHIRPDMPHLEVDIDKIKNSPKGIELADYELPCSYFYPSYSADKAANKKGILNWLESLNDLYE